MIRQFLLLMVFLRGSTPFVTLSSITKEDLGELDDDYDETATTAPAKRPIPVSGNSQRCDYRPCLENQPACSELQAATGCLCPGFTPYDTTPDAPELRSVSWNGSEVVVRWCAPNSKVTAYAVTIGGQRRVRFGKERRSGGVGDIEEITEVCVLAVNDAGDSKGNCMLYRPSDGGLALKAGLIGGSLGFLLLLTIALLLLWRHKRQRKQEARISMQVEGGAATIAPQ